MNITAELVKELRERTGGGLMECKKALEAVGGDIEAAVKMLRESGKAKADKKSGRIAAEGMIAVVLSPDEKTAIMMEVNCETDFVAKDENFRQFANKVATLGLQAKVNDVDALLALSVGGGENKTVAELRQELVAKIGENINIRRLILVSSANLLAHYVHSGRIGVLVAFKGGDVALGKDIAMHVAASKPVALSAIDLPQDILAQEKAVYLAQVKDSGKPQEIMEKMVQGRLQKFIDELTLLNQPFIKDQEIKVSSLLQKHNAEVTSFVRFEVGEGIEKGKTDFAAEVMAQVKS